MPKLERKKAIAIKIESTSGTDSVPTAALNAMLVGNFQWNPLEMNTEERDFVRAYLGNSESIAVSKWVEASFEIEIAGAGAAGTVPKYGPALRMCGFSETTSAGVSVTYAPVSGAFESASIYCNLDQLLHKSLFQMANVALMLDANKIPKFKFTTKGLYVPVTDTSAWAPVYTGFTKPLPVNKANTQLSLHSIAALVETLQLDVKNQVEYRSLYNFEGVQITDRKPGGSVSLEATSVATKDWYAAILATNTGALNVVHGLTAGNIVEINAPATQLIRPKYGNSQGIAMLQSDLVLMPSSGNDELTIVVR